MLAQVIFEGIVNGSILAMIAMGITLVWGVMGILSFTQGEFLMVGMYIAFYANRFLGIDPIICIPIAAAGLYLLGILIYKTIIAKAIKGPRLSQRLITFALSMVLINGVMILFGGRYNTISPLMFEGSFDLGFVVISRQKLVPLISSIIMISLMYLFLNKTKAGKAIKATSQDKGAAALVGINTDVAYARAFGLSSALAGAAGCVLTYYMPIYPAGGNSFLLFGFIAVLLGGMGSTVGALAGGIIMGITDTLTGVYFDPAFKYLAVCVMFMLIVSFKPKGMFGR